MKKILSLIFCFCLISSSALCKDNIKTYDCSFKEKNTNNRFTLPHITVINNKKVLMNDEPAGEFTNLEDDCFSINFNDGSILIYDNEEKTAVHIGTETNSRQNSIGKCTIKTK